MAIQILDRFGSSTNRAMTMFCAMMSVIVNELGKGQIVWLMRNIGYLGPNVQWLDSNTIGM